MRVLTVLFVALAGLASAVAAGADGGPSPGLAVGGAGLLGPKGEVRYVTVSDGRTTAIEVIAVRSGRVLRWGWVPGYYGLPLVAYDGTAGGLTRDGRTLVLAPFVGPALKKVTRFVLVNTRTFAPRQVVEVRGTFSFDALSPDGRTLYLIQYVRSQANQRYLVRAYDLVAGRLLKAPVADRREPGPMAGSPISRATNADGSWVYTLYQKPNGEAFVHALDAVRRAAVCVDLPWRKTQQWIWQVRMSVAGSTLVLRQPRVGRLAAIDTRTFAVRAFRKGVAPKP